MAAAEVAKKIEKAAGHFEALAARMRDLHTEVLKSERAVEDAMRENKDAQDEAKEATTRAGEVEMDHESLLEDLRCVRAGARDLDEVYEKWLRE